ncbi:MAG: TolC family outer membrane protein [Pseudomonas sp.]|uniref:TolC family outer membrane protein n=1 Tax=Pseudomonas sp. TaxID=306 RepID=UPI003396917B
MRFRFLSLLPFALSFSVQTHAQNLQAAIQKALDTHPEIQAGMHSRLAADQQLKAARGGYLPKVDVLAGYGREGTDDTSTRAAGGSDHWQNLNRSESSIRLQQMVFDGFATASEVGRQEATVNARAFSLKGTAERTALDVVQVYLDVLKRDELVRLAQDNLSSHERIYDQITLRSERGVGRLADLDQAEARLAQAKNNLITEQTNLADARTNYFSVVGEEADQLEPPAGLAGQLPESLADARRELLENSPVLRSAESDVVATEQQYDAAKSTFYPRFDAELSRNADNNIDGVDAHSNEWQAMLRMRYNLFSGGSNKADLEAKSYQINEALDIRNNALRTLNEELGLAWNALGNARQQVPVARQYADYSVRVRNGYQKQFSLSERTLLDVLDSENELFTAQRRLTELTYLELFTQYRIKAVTGALLKSQSVVAPLASNAMSEVRTRVALPGLK